MSASSKWFGWLCLMLPLHMAEQLVFGIDELAKLKQVLAIYYGRFQEPDAGTVLLVMLLGSLVNLLAFLIALGGRGRRIALCVFGLSGVLEAHHLIETAVAGHYTPGTVTAVPYILFGLLVLRAVARERQTERVSTHSAAPSLPQAAAF